LFVQLAKIRREVEVVLDKSSGIVFFGGDRGSFGRRWRRESGGDRRVCGAIVEIFGILTEGQYATMESHGPHVIS